MIENKFQMENHQTDNLVEGLSEQPVLIFNPTYGEYLFVSNDKLGDNVVESHPVQWRKEEKNIFVLQRRTNADNTCLIYNKSHELWLFVSNDKKDYGHVVEAHSSNNEETNAFQFQLVKDNRYRIYNPSSKEYLFVSKDTWGSDHGVESHSDLNEECNEFVLELVEPPESIEHIEFFMAKMKVIGTPEVQNLVIGTQQYRNDTSVLQSMNIKIDHTESHQSTFTYTGGFTVGATIGAATKLGGGIPFVASMELTLSTSLNLSTTHTFSHSSTCTSICTISGQVTVNAAPKKITTATIKIVQKEIEVPFKMTLRTKDGSRLYNYGVYKGIAWLDQFCEAKETPIDHNNKKWSNCILN